MEVISLTFYMLKTSMHFFSQQGDKDKKRPWQVEKGKRLSASYTGCQLLVFHRILPVPASSCSVCHLRPLSCVGQLSCSCALQ